MANGSEISEFGSRSSVSISSMAGANLRVLVVTEIKTVPYVPMSHPFVERLIGTIRREYLDIALFWTAVDLESKLSEFRDYYNLHRSHAGLAGKTPQEPPEVNVCATLRSYRWRGHCRGLFTRQSRHKQEFATDRIRENRAESFNRLG